MQGQIGLMEWLTQTMDNTPEENIRITGVVNVQARPICDYEVASTYKDIFLIVNMIDDYVSVLEQEEKRNYYVDHMIEQYKRISSSLSEQIQLDKEKMYLRCKKRLDSNEKNVGEDALTQIFRK